MHLSIYFVVHKAQRIIFEMISSDGGKFFKLLDKKSYLLLHYLKSLLKSGSCGFSQIQVKLEIEQKKTKNISIYLLG